MPMRPPRKRKKKSASAPAPLARLISFLWGPGRPLALGGLLVAVLLVGSHLVWKAVRPHVLSSDDYLVGPQKVEITPLPDWIHTDVRAEVFRNASLDAPLSIMDDDLAERISNAFSLHPWIAKVGQVKRLPLGRVTVELAYRRPVCMVEVRGDLLPVDVRGVLLPVEDFSPVEKGRYPRLAGVDTLPVATVGQCWGDPRVVGGAEIAAALAGAWAELKFSRIVPLAAASPRTADRYTYELLTRGGTRVLWGRAPGTNAPGEIDAAEKVARLRNYARQHGTLEGRDGPQELDVYRLRAVRVSSRPRL